MFMGVLVGSFIDDFEIIQLSSKAERTPERHVVQVLASDGANDSFDNRGE